MPFEANIRPIPLSRIKITDGFWAEWQKTLRETTIGAIYEQLVSTKRLQRFENAAKGEGEAEGYYYNDSDVYKWCEAAAYALALGPDTGIQKHLDHVIGLIEKAQEPSGYINTWMQLKHPELKLRNLVAMHEMYCIGHLVEAGVALYEEVGDRRLLDIGIKAIDHLMSIFGPDKKPGYCGHEEIELALLRLARTTKQPKYKEFARWMVEQRGVKPSFFQRELDDAEAQAISPWMRKMMTKEGEYSGEYVQDHAPVREHTEVVGHAVRAMYLYMAATELATDDPAMQQAMERTWHNLVAKRMYVTGGIGPSGSNEGFTYDYDLPNLSSYAETCASCGLAFWGQKLLETTGNGAYADIVERAIFNGALAGISASGKEFFYDNPLESRGTHNRVPWFDCACCPPNIARLIGSMGKYIAGTTSDAFWLHFPAAFETIATFNNTEVKIKCESDYPWSGRFVLRIEPAQPVQFALKLRIPEWSDEIETEVPGLEAESEYEDGYAIFNKVWEKGDTLTVDFNAVPRWIESDPRVLDNLGRVALTYGPLVYCAEQIDNNFPPQRFSVDVEAPIIENQNAQKTFTIEGFKEGDDFGDELYAPVETLSIKESKLTMVPYFSWNNRGANHMQVWLRR